MSTTQIFVTLADGAGHPLGSCWSVKTKKNDFYMEPLGAGKRDVMHLSLHGPWPGKPKHRFHIKIDESEAERKRKAGQLVAHGFPPGGQPLNGIQLSEDAFLVCRLRWMPSLQQPEYLGAASVGVTVPDLGPGKEGRLLNSSLAPASAWDLDLVVSYHAPFWPDGDQTKADNARLGPLENDANMFLTVTSYHRTVESSPPPEELVPGTPSDVETPNILMCGGIDERPDGEQDLYWFVETIVPRELLQSSFPDQVP